MSDVSLLSAGTPTPASNPAYNHQPTKLLYSRKECAYALNLSIRSIDMILSAGQMKIRRIGRRLLIPAESLASYARRDHTFLTQHPSGVAQ
jgi:hypothetical protein